MSITEPFLRQTSMETSAGVVALGDDPRPFPAGAITGRCVRWATPAGSATSAVVIRCALGSPDDELVVRGLLAAGWGLAAASIPLLTAPRSGPVLQVSVDENGDVQVHTAAGDLLFAGDLQEPVTQRWVDQACRQDVIPVLLGVWGVDLGNEVDLTRCARAGRLLITRATGTMPA